MSFMPEVSMMGEDSVAVLTVAPTGTVRARCYVRVFARSMALDAPNPRRYVSVVLAFA